MNKAYYIAFLVIVLVLAGNLAHAQIRGPKIWAFGEHAGLDFSTGQPVAITTEMQSYEASASQCDADGNLLFYTNGMNVWNAQHTVMHNGSGLSGNNPTSSMQGVLIVPFPGDTSRYYVFSHSPLESIASSGATGHLYYSIVDMDLDNGNGDIIPAQKNILLDSMLSEQMAVVPNTDCGYWLVTHDINQTIFKSFEINALGIQTTPLISNSSSFTPNNHFGSFSSGEMLYSLKRKKLFLTTPKGPGFSCYLEMHDFDPATGMLSNAQMLSDTNVALYLALSPDEGKLYASGLQYIGALLHGAIYQYDLSQPTVQDIRNSRTQVFYDPLVNIADMLLGPDDKIYVVTDFNGTSLGRIEQPDNAGIACDVRIGVVPLAPNTHAWAGLPSPVYNGWHIEKGRTLIDTTLCASSEILLEAPAGRLNYQWSGGSSANTFLATVDGLYWVRSSSACGERTDSFKVDINNISFSLGNDTAICERIQLNVPVANASYLWNTGETTQAINVLRTHEYTVTVTSSPCKASDTIYITNRNIHVSLGPDTLLCNGTSMEVALVVTKDASFLWSDGSTSAEYAFTQPGIYSVRAYNETCETADTIEVSFGECDCKPWVPSAFTPNGDGKNDKFGPALHPRCPAKSYRFQVFNRWGEMVFSSTDMREKWDGRYKGVTAEVGVYMYHAELTDIYGRKTYHKGDVMLVR